MTPPITTHWPRLDRDGPGDLRKTGLLFGLADSIQYRIQALSQIGRGTGTIPYEFLLMLPYVLTLVVLWFRTGRGAAPEVLGRPYVKGES